MAHVDYPGWAAHVESLWSLHEIRPRRLLETGAGTCRLAPFLARPGLRQVQSDLSPAMLTRGEGRADRRVAADFRRLPFREGSFDAVLCLYDAVNYCLEPDDLGAFFAEAARVVAPGGSLLFDCTTARNSRRHFLDATSHEVVEGVEIVRRSRWDAATSLQHNEFVFFAPVGGGLWRRQAEHHAQRIWPLRRFRQKAIEAGWQWLGAFDDDLAQADSNSERIHILLRREG